MTHFDERQWQSRGIAVLRVMVGAVLLAHGSQKLLMYGIGGTAGAFAHMGIPAPMLSAVLSIGAEFLGGLALVLGLFTRWAAAALTINMAVAVFGVSPEERVLPAGRRRVCLDAAGGQRRAGDDRRRGIRNGWGAA